MINYVLLKASRRFHVKVYRFAICGNHLHFLIRAYRREDAQNFFRVLAGHIAQNILAEFPISAKERKFAGRAAGGAPTQNFAIKESSRGGAPSDLGDSRPPAEIETLEARDEKTKPCCEKNRRKFWALLVYSRIVTWGKEFKIVSKYVLQNTLEALYIIAYQPRRKRKRLSPD